METCPGGEIKWPGISRNMASSTPKLVTRTSLNPLFREREAATALRSAMYQAGREHEPKGHGLRKLTHLQFLMSITSLMCRYRYIPYVMKDGSRQHGNLMRIMCGYPSGTPRHGPPEITGWESIRLAMYRRMETVFLAAWNNVKIRGWHPGTQASDIPR